MSHGHGHSAYTKSQPIEIPAPQTAWIWKTFWILSAITAFEFLIAFVKGPLNLPHLLVVTVFITLTLVKAFYIVADFMHLKHESKTLILSLALPIIFILWLIASQLNEGSYVFDAIHNFHHFLTK